jgi:hypothetical protein
MFEMITVTHICKENKPNCIHIWQTKEPKLITKSPIIYETCENCKEVD